MGGEEEKRNWSENVMRVSDIDQSIVVVGGVTFEVDYGAPPSMLSPVGAVVDADKPVEISAPAAVKGDGDEDASVESSSPGAKLKGDSDEAVGDMFVEARLESRREVMPEDWADLMMISTLVLKLTSSRSYTGEGYSSRLPPMVTTKKVKPALDDFKIEIDGDRDGNGDGGDLPLVPPFGWYDAWMLSVICFRVYSLIMTPVELAFFHHGLVGVPLWAVDGVTCVVLLANVVIRVVSTIRDNNYTFRNSTSILMDIFSCISWDFIYRVVFTRGFVRALLLFRVYHIWRLVVYVREMEIRFKVEFPLWSTIKKIVSKLYNIHVLGCIFYYLASMDPNEDSTNWLGSLETGGISNTNSHESSFWSLYLMTINFVVTFTTVGYGDIHPVNGKEMMIFLTILLLLKFNTNIGDVVSYLIGLLPVGGVMPQATRRVPGGGPVPQEADQANDNDAMEVEKKEPKRKGKIVQK